MSEYKNTRRFDNVAEEELAEVRAQLDELTDVFSLREGWADGILQEHRAAAAKANAVGDDASVIDPEAMLEADIDMQQGDPSAGLDDESREKVNELADWKWVSLFDLMPLQMAVMSQLGRELGALTDSDLRERYEASELVQGKFDTFEAFRVKMNELKQMYNMMHMVSGMVSDVMGSTMTYDHPPEVGETRIVQYVEPENPVLGAYNVAEADIPDTEALRTAEAEILGFEAPTDETQRALAHPNVRVRVDGQEYILPPGNVHAPDGVGGQSPMAGLGGMLGDALNGDMDGMDGSDLFGSGTDTDRFRLDDGDDEDDDEDDDGFGDLFDGEDFR